MITMDLVRFAALITIPVAFMVGRLSFVQLLVVSIVVAAADIAFKAASGAYLKSLVRGEQLLVANGRFEATMWTSTLLGPPLGGLAIGVLGPVTTIVANALSFVLSAAGIRAIGATEPGPAHANAPRMRSRDLVAGWRFILGNPALRPLFANTLLVNALIMAPAPLLALLMLGHLGFAPWQYALAFGGPCIGGLIGSRLARPLVARFGQRRVLLTSGTLRALWSIGLAFVGRGVGGLALVMAVQFGLVTCVGVFNPVLATFRLEQTSADRVTRTLSAWSVSGSATITLLTLSWGVLAAATSPRTAIAVAGVLMLATPLLLAGLRDRRD
jgi:hypothetical protein